MIDPRRLQVLRALADHGTVRAAAEALFLTPSAVSQQLTALEHEVGQSLLTRHGRRVCLTAAGELLVQHAKAVLAELERAESTMAACASGTTGRVEIASFASAITQVVAPSIVTLHDRAPGVRVLVRDAEAHDSLMLLLAGEADIALSMEYSSTSQADAQRITRYPLYAEPFDVVLPPKHPLAATSEVAVQDLRDAEWIAPLPGNPCRAVTQTHCENAGFSPRITHTSDDFNAVVALVAAGTGVALVPRTALAANPARPGSPALSDNSAFPGSPGFSDNSASPASHGAIVRPAVHGPTRRVFAAVPRGREDHPLLRMVLEVLLEAAQNM